MEEMFTAHQTNIKLQTRMKGHISSAQKDWRRRWTRKKQFLLRHVQAMSQEEYERPMKQRTRLIWELTRKQHIKCSSVSWKCWWAQRHGRVWRTNRNVPTSNKQKSNMIARCSDTTTRTVREQKSGKRATRTNRYVQMIRMVANRQGNDHQGTIPVFKGRELWKLIHGDVQERGVEDVLAWLNNSRGRCWDTRTGKHSKQTILITKSVSYWQIKFFWHRKASTKSQMSGTEWRRRKDLIIFSQRDQDYWKRRTDEPNAEGKNKTSKELKNACEDVVGIWLGKIKWRSASSTWTRKMEGTNI